MPDNESSTLGDQGYCRLFRGFHASAHLALPVEPWPHTAISGDRCSVCFVVRITGRNDQPARSFRKLVSGTDSIPDVIVVHSHRSGIQLEISFIPNFRLLHLVATGSNGTMASICDTPHSTIPLVRLAHFHAILPAADAQ